MSPREAALARIPLLAGFAPAALRALDAQLEWLEVEADVTLFREGEPADALLLVLDGRVALSTGHGLAGECGPGAALGPLSLVGDGPRQATARTGCRCRIVRLHRDAYRALRRSAPEAACALLENIVRESAALARDALDASAPGVPRADLRVG